MKVRVLGCLALVALLMLTACSPTPTATPEPSPSPSATPAFTPTPVATPTMTPSPTPTATATPEAPPGGATLRITPVSLSAAPGSFVAVTVEVVLAQVTLTAADLTLSFDPRVVRVVALETGEALGQSPVVGFEDVDQGRGRARIAVARVGRADGPTPGGALVTVNLRVQEGVGAGTTSALRIEEATLVDQRFAQLTALRLEDGELLVTAP